MHCALVNKYYDVYLCTQGANLLSIPVNSHGICYSSKSELFSKSKIMAKFYYKLKIGL